MSQVSFVSRRDLEFLINDVFNIEELYASAQFEHCDSEMVSAVIDTAFAIAQDHFWPAAAEVDADEARFDGKQVYTPQITKDCIKEFRDAGFFGMNFDLDRGGMQLPYLVQQVVSAIFGAAGPSISSYAFLTAANANLLNEHGSEAQKNKYLRPLVEGRWFGTMCLSETQAGSSLGDIRTMATPTEQEHYLLTGTKMWISGGDQDISENIIHMVLAKTPGAPAGVKGISLFLVPKYRVNDDGSLGDFNNIVLAGINHKMGHRGTTNTLLNFGESGECRGYLVGELNHGLANMFFMMNEARIGVGMSAASLGMGGFHYSLDYAKNRPQGRKLGSKDASSPQVMIIEHADIKRLLMLQKCYAEGAFALGFYCAKLVDQQQANQVDQAEAALLLDLLTPIAKSWPSEFCLEANKHAIQILGGYGYTREYPVERMYRDNRLNHIHEGAHGIQGLDLLGRKVILQNGLALKLFRKAVEKTVGKAKGFDGLLAYSDSLLEAVAATEKTVAAVFSVSDPELSLANATTFLDAFGHVVIAWLWLEQATIAAEKLKANSEDPFYQGKLAACQFFFRYELPKVATAYALVASLDDTCLKLDPALFDGQDFL